MNLALLQILNTLGSIFLIGRQMARADDLTSASEAQDVLQNSLNDFQAQVGDWGKCSNEIEELQVMTNALKEDIISLAGDTVQPACEVLEQIVDFKANSVSTGNSQHQLNKNSINALIGFLNDHDENCVA